MQRLELHFGRGEAAKYVGHLDLMRAWERALRRATIPLAYSHGFSPHPRIATAAPLPVGITSEAEAMDLWLEQPLAPTEFVARLTAQLPDGIALYRAVDVPPGWPSLAARLQTADYTARVLGHDPETSVKRLLAAPSLPRSEERDSKSRHYDLRPLVLGLRTEVNTAGEFTLWMRLRAGSQGTGRPQEVIAALGLEARAIHRTRLLFAEPNEP